MVRDRVNDGFKKKAKNSSSRWVRPKKRDVNCCESMVQCGPPKGESLLVPYPLGNVCQGLLPESVITGR